MVIWEMVAYLADDTKRLTAFRRLEQEVGLLPESILNAPIERLQDIARSGGKIAPELRADRMVEAATLTLQDFDGSLDSILSLPGKEALKQLQRFPMIGLPGAEKILLFSDMYPVLALESNGLRALLRLGFGEESSNYSASYRSVREAVRGQLPEDCSILKSAHILLRRHGQELCRASVPHCVACPVNQACATYSAMP